MTNLQGDLGVVLIISSNMKLRKLALFLELLVLGALANGTNGIVNTTTLSPTTNQVQVIEDHNKYVVDLTRDSFNVQVANKSHFVMFFDPM